MNGYFLNISFDKLQLHFNLLIFFVEVFSQWIFFGIILHDAGHEFSNH